MHQGIHSCFLQYNLEITKSKFMKVFKVSEDTIAKVIVSSLLSIELLWVKFKDLFDI